MEAAALGWGMATSRTKEFPWGPLLQTHSFIHAFSVPFTVVNHFVVLDNHYSVSQLIQISTVSKSAEPWAHSQSFILSFTYSFTRSSVDNLVSVVNHLLIIHSTNSFIHPRSVSGSLWFLLIHSLVQLVLASVNQSVIKQLVIFTHPFTNFFRLSKPVTNSLCPCIYSFIHGSFSSSDSYLVRQSVP